MCESGNENIVKILIDYRTDIHEENNYDETPFFYAYKNLN